MDVARAFFMFLYLDNAPLGDYPFVQEVLTL